MRDPFLVILYYEIVVDIIKYLCFNKCGEPLTL